MRLGIFSALPTVSPDSIRMCFAVASTASFAAPIAASGLSFDVVPHAPEQHWDR
jgi:hypothetical protein